MADSSQRFIKNHRSEIIQKTREPVALADRLRQNNLISDELYNKIQTQKHKEDQMREIYKCLNSKTHFDCLYNWLKEREANVLQDLETRDAEPEAPLHKRSRDETHETVDETDNISAELPDLKKISTFAKLETWVSDNSQKLISDLERKLGEEGLEALKKELKNRESKNSLCFKASKIKEINGNEELEDFLNKKNTKIPKLTFSTFFKNNDLASSGEKNENTTDYDEPMDTTDFNEKKDDKHMKNKHNDVMVGKSQCPGQSPNVSSKSPNEPVTKTETPVVDTHGGSDMQENEEAKMQDVMNAQNKDTDPVYCSVQQKHGSSMRFHTSTTRAVKDETGESSRSYTDSASGTSVTGSRKENKLKKKNAMDNLLRDWALRRCDGCKEGIKNVFDQISIINMAEHRDYPCFTAENVRVYENPRTSERQIIFIADEKMPKTSAKTMAHYHMFVCDLQKAVLLGPKEETEQVIKYEEGFIRIDKCKRFIFEVFAPTLAVFKKIQEEELYSLI